MRLCIVMGYYAADRIGGAELQMMYFAEQAAQRGVDVHYVTRSVNPRDAGTIKLRGVTIHRVASRLPRDMAGIELLPVARSVRADVYLNRSLDGTFVSWFAARSIGRPFIYSVAHDLDCALPRRPNLIRPGAWECYAYAHLNHWALQRAAVVIAQTCHQRELLKQNLGLVAPVVYNGHPLPSRTDSKSTLPIVCWIANIKPIKQPDRFVEIARACRDLPVRFQMVGRVDDNHTYQRLLTSLAEVPNLEYLGILSLNQANHLLAKASLLVNTSQSEGFPNTFIQAWLRRTPVASLGVDPDSLISGHNLGIVDRSLASLITRVRSLLAEPCRLDRIGEAAQAYATQHFTTERFTDACLGILSRASQHQ